MAALTVVGLVGYWNQVFTYFCCISGSVALLISES